MHVLFAIGGKPDENPCGQPPPHTHTLVSDMAIFTYYVNIFWNRWHTLHRLFESISYFGSTKYGCRTVRMQEWSDAVQDGCWTVQMQDRTDAVKVWYSTGQLLDTRQYGCWTEWMQDRSDAVQDGCWTVRMQNRTNAEQDGCSSVYGCKTSPIQG